MHDDILQKLKTSVLETMAANAEIITLESGEEFRHDGICLAALLLGEVETWSDDNTDASGIKVLEAYKLTCIGSEDLLKRDAGWKAKIRCVASTIPAKLAVWTRTALKDIL